MCVKLTPGHVGFRKVFRKDRLSGSLSVHPVNVVIGVRLCQFPPQTLVLRVETVEERPSVTRSMSKTEMVGTETNLFPTIFLIDISRIHFRQFFVREIYFHSTKIILFLSQVPDRVLTGVW